MLNLFSSFYYNLIYTCFYLKLLIYVLTFSLMFSLVLVVALEKVERSSGSLIGSSIASIQKSTAPEVIFGTFQIYLSRQKHMMQYGYSLYLDADAACPHG